MGANAASLTFPDNEIFLNDVLEGLARQPKRIAPKYFYDAAGSALFDRICELPEYYPTRTESGILQQFGPDMAAALGPDVLLIEPGCGSCTKVRYLLDALQRPAGFVPVEISGEHMLENLAPLQEGFPELPVHPLCADFTRPFGLPDGIADEARRVVFFPGSTLGNFPAGEALQLLRGMRKLVGSGGQMLLGVDLVKNALILQQAYNDQAGVTAAFNRNLLQRINTELNGDFAPEAFRHRALWNSGQSRIEMHLISETDQTVTISGQPVAFRTGETLVTEYSYKYSDDSLQTLAENAGFRIRQRWSDEREWFGVYLLDAN